MDVARATRSGKLRAARVTRAINARGNTTMVLVPVPAREIAAFAAGFDHFRPAWGICPAR